MIRTRPLLFVTLSTVLTVFIAREAVRAQEIAKTTADGVYSEAQANRGAAAYEAVCANCHRGDLGGNSGPALKEQRFARIYAGKDLKALYTKIATTMPRNAPASLADDVYLDIIAHVLKENGFRAGAQELTAAALESIRIVPGQAKPPPVLGDFSYVDVVGCLTPGPRRTWMLTHASDPIVAAPTAAASSIDANHPLGGQTVHLLDATAYAPDRHVGHKMHVRGLLIRLPGEQRMTISAIDMIATTCSG